MIISGANNEAIVRHIVDRFDHLKQNRKDKELVWLECIRAYLSQFEEPWNQDAMNRRSKRYVALSFDAVETLQSILMALLFGRSDKFIGLEPRIPGRLEHDDEAASEMRALLYMQFDRDGMYRKAGSLFKQLAIVGNAPYTVQWRKELAVNYPAYAEAMEKWKAQHAKAWREYEILTAHWKQAAMAAANNGQEPPPRPHIIAPEPPPVDTRLAFEGPTLEVGDIFNFVIDPFSIDPKHALKIKRSWVSKSALAALAERDEDGYSVYSNLSEIQEVDRRTGTTRDDYLEERYNAFGLQVPDASMVEVLEMSGTMEIDGGHFDENRRTFVSYIGTVANGRTLIRFEPTFLWSGESPTELATYRDVPGQVYGIGALESALGLQDLVNARSNQAVDVVNYVLNPEFKAVDDGVIERNPRSAPNKVHWVGDLNNLVPIPKDISGLSISMQDLPQLKNEFQLLTKANTPVGGNSRESATKTGLDANIIAQDIGKVARHIEDSCINVLFDKMIQLNCQFVTKEVGVRFLQKGQVVFKDLSPATIRRGWAMKSRGTQFYADRQEKIQNLFMFMNLIGVSPVMSAPVNLLELEKRIAEELGIEDGGTIFRDGEDADRILGEFMRMGLIGNGPAQLPAAGGPA